MKNSNSKIFETAETFYSVIPRNLEANRDFRKSLHTIIEKDKSLQKVYLQLCLQDYKIAFNSMFFTYNPRLPNGMRTWPFILRQPCQEKCVDTLRHCINAQEDMGINKSRDEGATEMVTKTFALLSLVPESYFIVGSRSKDIVDNVGDSTTLMAKIRQAFDCMPNWLKQSMGQIDDKDMQLVVPSTGSVIRGETTNENFSAGRRATALLLDEFGRVEPRPAESIEGSIHDVTGCVIYCSTHWFGTTHPFNRCLNKPSTNRVNLLWYDNPVKNMGLYKSPDYNVIEIVDTDYYKENYPRISTLHSNESFKLSELEKELICQGYEGETPTFIADKCDNIPGDLRAPWHDSEEEKRRGNKRDFFSNIWGCPLGAQDSFFDHVIVDRAESQFALDSTESGEFHLSTKRGKVSWATFRAGLGRKRFQWWGELEGGRPDQEHNYVIGCDISYGQGSSNSVAKIYDCNLKEEVGVWCCPNTSVEDFADLVVGIAFWCGGTRPALINFETNGPGTIFGKRLQWQGYYHIYTQRTEDSKHIKRKNRLGWTSNPNAKESLLGDMALSVTESLKSESSHWSCKIHDKDTFDEMRRYVFFSSGEIGISESMDETSGARKRHGDRVIASALCILGAKYQMPGHLEKLQYAPADTMQYWIEQDEEKRKRERKETRRYLY